MLPYRVICDIINVNEIEPRTLPNIHCGKLREKEVGKLEDLLLTIRKAMEYRRRMRIIYEKDGAFTERTIRPYLLKDNELYAYCYMRGSKRRFRLDHIIGAVMLSEEEKGKET